MSKQSQNGHSTPGAMPPRAPGWWVRNARRIVAATVVAVFWIAMRPPQVSAALRSAVARRFHIERVAMPEVGAGPYAMERQVQPSTKRFISWMSAVGTSVALNDLDGDGLPNDICSTDPRTDTVMIAPAPGTPPRYAPFALDPAPLLFDKVTMKPFGCVPGDVNEDGVTDAVVYYYGRPPIAFLHTGDPTSHTYKPVEIVPQNGSEISAVDRWCTSAVTLADLDGDGHLDLFAVDYFPDGSRLFDASPAHASEVQEMQRSMSKALNGGKKHILLWKGATGGAAPSVQFEEVKGVLDEETNNGWSLAIAAQDLDGDLLPEIYIANDFGPDRLLHNRSTPGHLSFVRLEGERGLGSAHSKVVGRDSFKGMGVDFADINGDGLSDMMVSSIAAEYALMEHHLMFVSTGDTAAMKRGVAPYQDLSDPLGLARSSWGWDIKFVDLDNDGTQEVLQSVGFIRGTVSKWPELQELSTANDELVPRPLAWPRLELGDEIAGHEAQPVFVKIGERYFDMSREIGLGEPSVSRGIATWTTRSPTSGSLRASTRTTARSRPSAAHSWVCICGCRSARGWFRPRSSGRDTRRAMAAAARSR